MKKPSDMSNYMRFEMWMDRILETISSWEHLQGITVPDEVRDSVIKFMRVKVKKGIKKGTLIRTFMQIAVTALLYIKMKGWDK